MSARPSAALLLPLALCGLATSSTTRSQPPPVTTAWRAALTETYQALSNRQFTKISDPLGRARAYARAYPSHRYAAKTLEYGALELMLQFRYSEATREYLRTRDAAARVSDHATAAGAMHALSNIYWQAGNLPAARQAAEQALAALPRQTVPLLRGSMRNHYARILARTGRQSEAQKIFAEVVELARRHGLSLLEADAWKLSSREQALAGVTEPAREALEHSIAIRRKIGDGELASDYHDMADVEIRAGRPRQALAWLDQAAAEAPRARRFVTWRIEVARGRARLALGETRQALAMLREAARKRRESRTFLLPGDWLRTHSNGSVEDPFALLTEAALGEYNRTGQGAYLMEAFAASEERRASSLRAVQREASIPPERARQYWQTVGEFDEAYAAMIRQGADPRASRHLDELRLRLAEIEAGSEDELAEPGAGTGENALPPLQPQEALITLQVGEQRSWAWTVTGGRLTATALPARAVLEKQVNRWLSNPDHQPTSLATCKLLFGGLPAEVHRAQEWLVAADGVFFGAPFAALVMEGAAGGDGASQRSEPGARSHPPPLFAQRGGDNGEAKPAAVVKRSSALSGERRPTFLVDRHALQLVPGSWTLWQRRAARQSGGFLGIGDPIYNQADPRIRQGRWSWLSRWGGRTQDDRELTRLAGSGPEIDRCARLWPWGQLLKGADATPERLAEALTQSSHAVVHLATHVVPAPDQAEENLIALSHGRDGRPAYVGPEWVGARRLDRALVVVNGCRSGSGAITPEGLMGLSRAWLRAGASRVLSTHWATNDDAGALVEAFHREIRRGTRHAEALRRAQLAMMAGDGWRGSIRHWAAYFLVGHPE